MAPGSLLAFATHSAVESGHIVPRGGPSHQIEGCVGGGAGSAVGTLLGRVERADEAGQVALPRFVPVPLSLLVGTPLWEPCYLHKNQAL